MISKILDLIDIVVLGTFGLFLGMIFIAAFVIAAIFFPIFNLMNKKR